MLSAIYTAVGELVGEGADKVSFPVIAERAGVNPTTLYRRWGDVNALLEEVAVAALTRDGESLPDTGSLEQDLTEWATIIARDITRPFVLVDGHIQVPTGPGIGVVPDPAALAEVTTRTEWIPL